MVPAAAVARWGGAATHVEIRASRAAVAVCDGWPEIAVVTGTPENTAEATSRSEVERGRPDSRNTISKVVIITIPAILTP